MSTNLYYLQTPPPNAEKWVKQWFKTLMDALVRTRDVQTDSVTVPGSLVLPPATVALAAGNNNDVTVEATVLRVTVDAAGSTITGVAGGMDGRLLLILADATGGNLVISNEGVGSQAANRFANPNSATLTFLPAARPLAIGFVYDGVAARWVRRG